MSVDGVESVLDINSHDRSTSSSRSVETRGYALAAERRKAPLAFALANGAEAGQEEWGDDAASGLAEQLTGTDRPNSTPRLR